MQKNSRRSFWKDFLKKLTLDLAIPSVQSRLCKSKVQNSVREQQLKRAFQHLLLAATKVRNAKGSLGRAFAVVIRTVDSDQVGICPCARGRVSRRTEPAFRHLRYSLTDVPPQSNSPPESVCRIRSRSRAPRSRSRDFASFTLILK